MDLNFNVVIVDGASGDEEWRGPAAELLAAQLEDEEVRSAVEGLSRHPDLVLPVGFSRICRELPEEGE